MLSALSRIVWLVILTQVILIAGNNKNSKTTRVEPSDDSDKIINLPNAPSNLNCDMYSGYFEVNNKNGRNLFYWLVESDKDVSNPEDKPLVIWLNGGPGCSSLIGLFTENGPIQPTKDGLIKNPYSWNKFANMLYIESPSGVGFSYSNTPSDYTTGDEKTTKDLLIFLGVFIGKYPRYVNRDVYVSGESYGGHYVPNLSLGLLEVNLAIKFKGFLVGNPWTYPQLDNNGTTLFWFSHAIISPEIYISILQNCNFSNSGPFEHYSNNQNCNEVIKQADSLIAHINPYNIYANVCLASQYSDGIQLKQMLIKAGDNLAKAFQTNTKKSLTDPCISNFQNEYLNRPDVKSAIHAFSKIKWTECSQSLNYSIQDLLTPMKPVYAKILSFNPTPRILVYSGDVDGAVPWLGTIFWLTDLEKSGLIRATNNWDVWMDSGNQIGGYYRTYDKMLFSTIRDAGHPVPSDQPARILELFEYFLNQ